MQVLMTTIPTLIRNFPWSITVLALCLAIGLAAAAISCNQNPPTGFQPGEARRVVNSPVVSQPEAAVPTVPPPAARPTEVPTPVVPPSPTPRGTVSPANLETTPEAQAPVTPRPTPTAVAQPTPPPPSGPITLSFNLVNDQTITSAPTARLVAPGIPGLSHYEIAVGTSMGGSDITGRTNIGTLTEYRMQNGVDGVQLSLDYNRDYYLTVWAFDTTGRLVGSAGSQAWFVHSPFRFDVDRYASVMRNAPNSFWGIRHPDPRYVTWDESFEAFVAGSAAIDLYHNLGERVLVGSDRVSILQTENNYPARSDVIRLGPAGDSGNHADTVASMLYDCEVSESRQSYYRGCQVNSLKYSMTSAELAARLSDVPPALENVNEFRNALFGEMGAPQIMTMSHAHPTSINRDGDFATAQAQNLRLGDWIFSQFNILAISTQPGSYAGHENPTLGGNYYNSIVVGKKSYNYTYPAQSSVDNSNGPRNKPDIVVAASSLAEASSWSAPTLAAAASGFLALAYSDPHLAGATYMQTMKAIILAGAGKNYLCPESSIETEGYCNALPSRSEQWQWTNSETAPLDPNYGVGLFNYRNSFQILTAGRSIGSVQSRNAGWDSQEIAEGQSSFYPFTVTQPNDEFSLALTWNRDVELDADGNFSFSLADLQVELLDGANRVLARSDDLGNNIEHIYVPGGLAVGQPYTIAVKAKTTASPIRYGLAWQARRSALQHEVWRE